MNRRAVLLGLLIVATLCPRGLGAYVAYEANAFPEQEGWNVGGDPEDPAIYTRSIQDGALAINATADGAALVFYHRDVLVPTANVFYEWRARTSNDDGVSYLSLVLEGPQQWSKVLVDWSGNFAHVYFGPDTQVHSGQYVEVPIAAGPFHTFRLEALGALHTLYIDGAPALDSALQAAAGLNVDVQFGFTKSLDAISTQSDWDYIRIGAIPEPSVLVLTLAGLPWLMRRRHRPDCMRAQYRSGPLRRTPNVV